MYTTIHDFKQQCTQWSRSKRLLFPAKDYQIFINPPTFFSESPDSSRRLMLFFDVMYAYQNSLIVRFFPSFQRFYLSNTYQHFYTLSRLYALESPDDWYTLDTMVLFYQNPSQNPLIKLLTKPSSWPFKKRKQCIHLILKQLKINALIDEVSINDTLPLLENHWMFLENKIEPVIHALFEAERCQSGGALQLAKRLIPMIQSGQLHDEHVQANLDALSCPFLPTKMDKLLTIMHTLGFLKCPDSQDYLDLLRQKALDSSTETDLTPSDFIEDLVVAWITLFEKLSSNPPRPIGYYLRLIAQLNNPLMMALKLTQLHSRQLLNDETEQWIVENKPHEPLLKIYHVFKKLNVLLSPSLISLFLSHQDPLAMARIIATLCKHQVIYVHQANIMCDLSFIFTSQSPKTHLYLMRLLRNNHLLSYDNYQNVVKHEAIFILADWSVVQSNVCLNQKTYDDIIQLAENTCLGLNTPEACAQAITQRLIGANDTPLVVSPPYRDTRGYRFEVLSSFAYAATALHQHYQQYMKKPLLLSFLQKAIATKQKKATMNQQTAIASLLKRSQLTVDLIQQTGRTYFYPGTDISLYTLLTLCWTAINDDVALMISQCSLYTAYIQFFRALSEMTDRNLESFCPSSMFNRLIESMIGISPYVEVRFFTLQTAGEKFRQLVIQHAHAHANETIHLSWDQHIAAIGDELYEEFHHQESLCPRTGLFPDGRYGATLMELLKSERDITFPQGCPQPTRQQATLKIPAEPHIKAVSAPKTSHGWFKTNTIVPTIDPQEEINDVRDFSAHSGFEKSRSSSLSL